MIQKLTQPEPAPPWGVLSALGAVIATFAALVVGTTIAQVLLQATPQALMTGWSIGMILTTVFVMVTRSRTPADTQAMRMGPTTTRLPIVLMLALGIAITFDLLGAAVTGRQTLSAAELLTFSRASVDAFGWFIAFIFMVILQPFGESLIFQGILFPALRTSLGAWAGLLMCAAFQGLFHFVAYPPPPENQTVLLWYGLALPFLTALVITSVRAYTGSTRAAIIAHAGFGLFAVLKTLTLGG